MRRIAQKLSERWGQPVIVESRPGGSAMIGTEFVVRSATGVIGSSAEALAARQKTDIEKYRRIAAAAGITPE